MSHDTTDTPAALGGNAKAEVKRRVERRIVLLDKMAELQEDLKALKADDKADGFDEKAIADAVRMRRADADKVLAQLTFETVRDLYRDAAGVPVDLETAQERAREEAETLPEPERKRRRRGDGLQADLEDALSDPALAGTSLSIDGGDTYHELGPSRRKRN